MLSDPTLHRNAVIVHTCLILNFFLASSALEANKLEVRKKNTFFDPVSIDKRNIGMILVLNTGRLSEKKG